MKYIISGTNRPGSRTRQICNLIQKIHSELGEKTEILDLCDLPFEELTGHHYGGAGLHMDWDEAVKKMTGAEGLIFVVPEYNGSMPGALKYFIDHWKYPDTFEYRPVAFVGLGITYGGVRPIEHLQQIMAYRNAFQFPNRVFMRDITKTLKDGELHDAMALQLLREQAAGFQKFVNALQGQGLDANSVNATRTKK